MGMLIMLRRFSTAGRWCEYEMEFGTTRKRLKPLFDCAVNHMLDHHRHLNYNAKMWRPHFPTYAAALSAKNSPLRACVGFVDGTVLPIAKPTRNERGCYDGKNRCHALKFQSLCLANGMIGHFYGPECGGVHDSTMMGRSQLLHQFESCCGAPNQPNHYYMFGDPAYAMCDYIIKPFGGSRTSKRTRRFNAKMAKVCIMVEWSFGKISSLWGLFRDKYRLQVYAGRTAGAPSIGDWFNVAAILTNCHSCLYGSNASRYTGVPTPSLESYLCAHPDA